MYRNVSSPIFDAPEFPTLRRVKPLPKRRRTSSTQLSVLSPGPTNSSEFGVESFPRMFVAESNGVPHSLHMPGLPPIPLTLPGPDATAEELLAHTDALRSYHLPIFDSAAAANLIAVADGSEPGSVPPGPGSDLFSELDLSNLASSYAVNLAGLGINNLSLRDKDEDSNHDDGDYIDPMPHPTNTKKRKVPANMSRLAGAHDSSSGQSNDDETEDHDGTLMIGIPTGTFDSDVKEDDTGQGDGAGAGAGAAEGEGKTPISAMRRLLARKRNRLSAVTLAGLQHKEMLKARKRQLATVLGALSIGDMLALDQALSNQTNYPFLGSSPLTSSASGIDVSSASTPPKVRLSKRSGPRLARRLVGRLKENERSRVQVPESKFSFVCHSTTSERLLATKKEVAILRRRFEEELARQTSNAASSTATHRPAATSVNSKSSRSKRGDRGRTDKKPRGQRNEYSNSSESNQISGAGGGGLMTSSAATTTTSPQQQQQLVAEDNAGNTNNANVKPTSRSGKKKKRSALANASNPHHLRNYVPSRLPQSAGGTPPNVAGTNHANANDLGPFPLRFLSAEIPPRRGPRSKRSQAQEQPQHQQQQQQQQQPPSSLLTTSLTNPAEEWLCVFCEYELFFGDEMEYRKALNRRKAVLKRRRRARERAAAAASGQTKVSSTSKKSSSQQPAPVAARRDSEEDGDEEEEVDPEDAEYEPNGTGSQSSGNGVHPGMLPKQTKWRGDNREKGGAGEAKSSYG
ncbi:hypothetical protein C8R42DRAFT_697262 [Lentinula raphanica]|nr:hypothetical protein C8R42DRAFT_697262 [Lentinula raphanica]